MDWSKIERIVHQQHENLFARSTGTAFSGRQTFTSSTKSNWFQSTNRSPEHEVHVNQRSNDMSYLRPPPPGDYQHGLVDDVASLQKGLYDVVARINELQEGLTRQGNVVQHKEEIENRMEEMERKLAVTSQHLNTSLQSNEQLQVQSRRLQSQVEDLHKLTATLQESSVSKEIFSKLLDSQRIENKQLQGEMTQSAVLSRSVQTQLQQLLRTICSFGEIEPAKLELLTSNNVIGGNELFMHQLGDIILQSLQHGVDISVSQHVIMLKSTLNTVIANLLNEFKTRQLAAMQPHFDRMQVLQSEVATTQSQVSELQTDVTTLQSEAKVNAINHEKQAKVIDTIVSLPPPPAAASSHSEAAVQLEEDMKLIKQELQAFLTQQAVQKTQLTQLFTEQQHITQLISDSQKSTLQTQNLRFNALENQILEQAENGEFSKRLQSFENRLSEYMTSNTDKNRDFFDRFIAIKHDVQQLSETQQTQKVELLSQLENRVLMVQEEQRVSLAKMILEVNDQIREKLRVVQAETHTLQQQAQQEAEKTDIKGEDSLLDSKAQFFHDQIKQLQLEIDTLQSRLLSSHDEFRVLITARDADLVNRVNDRIAHLESLKKDFFHFQKSTLQELEEKVVSLSGKVDDLQSTQHSVVNNSVNHVLEERIELLLHEQETLKARLTSLQILADTSKTDLLTEIDKCEKSLQRQLQTQDNRHVTDLNTVNNQVQILEQSLQKSYEKQGVEVEKTQESVAALHLKVRNCEYEIQTQHESLTRFDNKLSTTETELLHSIESKTQLLEQELLSQVHQLKLQLTSQNSETASKVQVITQKFEFLTAHCENKFTQIDGKIEENYATQSRLYVEGEAAHQAQQIRLSAQVDELKSDITTHLSTIALQQEQLSAHIEKLDLSTSQKTLLLETEGIATKNITKAEINKVAKSVNEVCEELKFDVSHVNNRLLILEQQVNFAETSSLPPTAQQQQYQQLPSQQQQQQQKETAAVLATLQKSLASQQEQLQVLQEELVTLDTNNNTQNGQLEAMQSQLLQLQQAQQQLLQQQQQMMTRTNSNNSISYVADSKQPPPRISQTSPKPGAVNGPPISAIAAFMSPQQPQTQSAQQQQPVKALNPAVARAMAADPRVMPQSVGVTDAKGLASSGSAMLTPAKPSAPSSSRQQQQPVHHGTVLLSPMTYGPNAAATSSSSAAVAVDMSGAGSFSSLHPSPPSAVKNAANVSPRPRLSPPAPASVAASSTAAAAVSVAARRFHPNQEEDDEDSHDHMKQQQLQQQVIDERSFESDDEDPPLHLLDEVMKKDESLLHVHAKHIEAGPETEASSSPHVSSTTTTASTLHLTKGAPPSMDPSATVMTSAASVPKTPPKHPHYQQQSKAVVEAQPEQKLSVETTTAIAAPIPIQPFSPAAQSLTPAGGPPLQRTLSTGSNSSTISSASKFSRRFNEASNTPPPTNSSRRSDSFDEDEAAHMLSGSFEGIALHLGSGVDDEHEFVSDSGSDNERSGVLSSLPGSAVKPAVFTGMAQAPPTVGAPETTLAVSKTAKGIVDVGAVTTDSKVSVSSDKKPVSSTKLVDTTKKEAEIKIPQEAAVSHQATATDSASSGIISAPNTLAVSKTATGIVNVGIVTSDSKVSGISDAKLVSASKPANMTKMEEETKLPQSAQSAQPAVVQQTALTKVVSAGAGTGVTLSQAALPNSTGSAFDTHAATKTATDIVDLRTVAADSKVAVGSDSKLVTSLKPVDATKKEEEIKMPKEAAVHQTTATETALAGTNSTTSSSQIAAAMSSTAAPAPAVIVSGSLLGRGGIQRK